MYQAKQKNGLGLTPERVIDWLLSPDGKFGKNPIKGRDQFLIQTLESSTKTLIKNSAQTWTSDLWAEKIQAYHVKASIVKCYTFRHSQKIDVGPYPRGGNSNTLNNTGGFDNQYSGASFRILVDTEDWDRTLAMNNPVKAVILIAIITITYSPNGQRMVFSIILLKR